MSWHDAQVVLCRPSEKVTVSNILLMSDNFKLLKYIGAFFVIESSVTLQFRRLYWTKNSKKLISDYKHFSFPFFSATINFMSLWWSSMCPSVFLLTCILVVFVITVWLPLVFCWIEHLYAQKIKQTSVLNLQFFLRNFVKILTQRILLKFAKASKKIYWGWSREAVWKTTKSAKFSKLRLVTSQLISKIR